MVALLRLLLGGLSFAAPLPAELRLTPTLVELELDGVKLKQLAFADENQTATYQSPRGWAYSGSATQLTLHPPNKPQS